MIHIFSRDFYFLADDRQRTKLVTMLKEYIWNNEINLVAIFLCLVVLIAFILIKRKHPKQRKAFYVLLFALYTICLYLFIILGNESGICGYKTTADVYLSGENGFHETAVSFAVVKLFLFIPYGVLIRNAFRKFWWLWMLQIPFLFGIFLEINQYLLAKGYSTVSDVVIYVFATCIGALLAQICRKKHRKHRRTDNVAAS